MFKIVNPGPTVSSAPNIIEGTYEPKAATVIVTALDITVSLVCDPAFNSRLWLGNGFTHPIDILSR